MGQFDKAFADFDKAIQLDARQCRCLRLPRICYTFNIANTTKRSPILPRRFGSNPNSGADCICGGQCAMFGSGNYDKAIADCNKAIELDPKYNSYGTRAAAYANSGEYDKAVTDYNEAIRLSPKDSQLHVYRGTVFSMKGAFDKALADARTAIKLDPHER